MKQKTWKEIAIILLVIDAIIITFALGDPHDFLAFWEAFRHLFGLAMIPLISLFS